ncbi:outer membrane beta-barrel protein [Hymenobacter convexus]|uniref:outer membrane beta-barrel protein n=1 Tax=Hymenobacter sp. CA1UV-4 TaxID=3063782 RepID=UPI00271283D2|nr:outer membrane beta-barrel protein [Hymenobacter sp. CA1UV-4]MDO7852798.1 outer membrane beta-barrel protein [Hymenobacter sp. CA1UV-4]
MLPLVGDTLRGEVDLQEGRLNAQACRFRPMAAAEVVAYRPEQLRAYGFTTQVRHYRSLPVTLEENAAPQRYFLEVLADGPASLYFLRTASQREEYFVGLQNQPLAILRHGMVQRAAGATEFKTVMDTGYRNTLQAALADCPAVEKKLRTLPFQENALISVINTYNGKCRGQQSRNQSVAAVSHFTIGLVAGGALHTLTYDGFPFGNDFKQKNTSVGFALGPTVQYRSERLSQRISLVASLLYEPEKYEIGLDNINLAGAGARIQFDFAYLRLPLMVRYTYPRGKVVPIAEVGLTAAYAVKTDVSSGTVTNGQYTAYPGPVTDILTSASRSSQVGFGGGVGVGIRPAGGHAMALLLRAERTNGFVDGFGIGTATLHFYGLLAYDLTK